MKNTELITSLEDVRYHLPASKHKAVIDEAIDLIKNQQAEIDRLKSIIKTNDEIIAELEEQQELDETADGGASCHLCIKVHTDNAIKEFAEKLKAKLVKYDMYGTLEISNDIDNLVAEMVGADNGN